MRFRDLRIRAGLTVRRAAEELGVKDWTIYKSESPTNPKGPHGDVFFFYQMTQVYQCTFQELVDAYRAARN